MRQTIINGWMEKVGNALLKSKFALGGGETYKDGEKYL